MKIYFFPGLGADSRLAPFHVLPGLEAHWVNWPEHFGNTWDEFINEIMNENKIESNSYFAGISFGGSVAQRVGQIVKPKRIFLISSFPKTRFISPILRFFFKFVKFIPGFLFKISFFPKMIIRYFFGITKPDNLDLFIRMTNSLSGQRTKHLVCLALSEPNFSAEELPIFRIHGTNDKIIPPRGQAIDYWIKDGGHLISMTHSQIINDEIIKQTKE